MYYANLHDDLGFEVARRVELGEPDAGAIFEEIYHPRMKQGGLNLQFYTVGGDAPRFCGSEDLLRGTLRRIELIRRIVAERPEYRLVEEAADLAWTKEPGHVGLVLTIEGAAPIGLDLGVLHALARLGLRSVCLMWFRANQVGDGVGEARAAGLTTFGRELVRAMNRLGLLIDVAQAAPSTIDDVLAESNSPIVASHCNAQGLFPHVRNLSDDHIRAIAQGGGLIGLTSYPAHVGRGAVELEDFLRHVDYVSELVGPQHVSLGLNIIAGSFEEETRFFERSRIEYAELWLNGLQDVHALPTLEQALRARGYDERAIAGIMGENLRRLVAGMLPLANRPHPSDQVVAEGT